MANDVEFPDEEATERTIVTEGFFEREVYLSRMETANFLRQIADALEADTKLTVSGSTWEIPFEYREPIEVEVEFVGQRSKELEIEIEFDEARDGTDLNVS